MKTTEKILNGLYNGAITVGTTIAAVLGLLVLISIIADGGFAGWLMAILAAGMVTMKVGAEFLEEASTDE